MRRQRIPSRPSSPIPRLKCVHFLILFAVSFIAGFSAFSVAYFAGSTIIRVFVVQVFFAGPDEIKHPDSLRDLMELYKPKEYPGRQRSLNIDHRIRYKDFDYLNPSTLTYKSAIYDDDIEILYRLPEKTTVSALLLIFHSCRETAQDWFHTVERQRIIGGAISLGYASLVFQAADNSTGCWSNKADIYANKDIQRVLKALDGFYAENADLAKLPRFTFGASSGGIFSSIFAINQRYPIHGQTLYISIILPEILYNHVTSNSYPPTVWIRMLRDVEFASENRINKSQQIFIKENIPFKTLIIEPIRLMRSTFHDRIPTLSVVASHLLLTKLIRNHWLNGRSYLMYNPRRKFEWKEFLFPTSDEKSMIEAIKQIHEHRNQISECLNVIYCEHAVSYERSYEALQWLEEQYEKSKTQSKSSN